MTGFLCNFIYLFFFRLLFLLLARGSEKRLELLVTLSFLDVKQDFADILSV